MKDVRTKSRKTEPFPPLSEKCPHWINPYTPLVRADTRKISKNPKFFAPKSADICI